MVFLQHYRAQRPLVRAHSSVVRPPFIFTHDSCRELNCQALYTFNQVFILTIAVVCKRSLYYVVHGKLRHWHGQRQSLASNVSEID